MRRWTSTRIGDFRSDTVTVPSKEMRRIIAEAEVGDDVFGTDTTVKNLECFVAELTGKEAAMFAASGTMTNQIGLRLNLNVLESVICDRRAHVFHYEAGGIAGHSQAQAIPVDGPLTAEKIARHVLGSDQHLAKTTVVSIENTLLGSVMDLEEIKRIRQLCRTTNGGMKLHMDGARLWNACVKTGISIADYASQVDTLSLCLSKGLGAPVGSMLVGTKTDIERARHFRKWMGGGWRQAGLLAAAGRYAIENHWKRMAEDHDLAAELGSQLERKVGLKLAMPVETNIVWIDVSAESGSNVIVDWKAAAEELQTRHNIIISSAYDKYASKLRFVTHLNVNIDHVRTLVDVLMRFRK